MYMYIYIYTYVSPICKADKITGQFSCPYTNQGRPLSVVRIQQQGLIDITIDLLYFVVCSHLTRIVSCACICIKICMRICIFIYIYVYVYGCICIYIYMYKYRCIYIYMYMYIQRAGGCGSPLFLNYFTTYIAQYIWLILQIVQQFGFKLLKFQ